MKFYVTVWLLLSITCIKASFRNNERTGELRSDAKTVEVPHTPVFDRKTGKVVQPDWNDLQQAVQVRHTGKAPDAVTLRDRINQEGGRKK